MNVNYPGLRYLLETYGTQGFEVVCVPCNQFGGQAPGTSAEERQAAINKFGVDTLIVVDKELVNGPHAHPLYAYLKSEQPVSFPNAAGRTPAASLSKDQGAIEWNYTKFLVDRRGIPVKRFKSAYDPLDFEGDVRLLLQGVCSPLHFIIRVYIHIYIPKRDWSIFSCRITTYSRRMCVTSRKKGVQC